MRASIEIGIFSGTFECCSYARILQWNSEVKQSMRIYTKITTYILFIQRFFFSSSVSSMNEKCVYLTKLHIRTWSICIRFNKTHIRACSCTGFLRFMLGCCYCIYLRFLRSYLSSLVLCLCINITPCCKSSKTYNMCVLYLWNSTDKY